VILPPANYCLPLEVGFTNGSFYLPLKMIQSGQVLFRNKNMVTITVDVKKADQELQDLLSQVAAGKEVVFKQGGQVVARLVPAGKRIAGLHAGAVKTTPDFDAPLPNAFRIDGKK
jgi:antitoxin (DNA-binding transcriptional repressor) of toxin-antitoxin stability system